MLRAVSALMRAQDQDRKTPGPPEKREPMKLDCGCCQIRSWESTDLHPLVLQANNPKIAAQMRDRFPNPYTLQAGQQWLDFAVGAIPEHNFALEAKGELVGGIGYIPGEDIESCAAEIGYWLGEDSWGNGIATAALSHLVAHLFQTEAYARIFALPFEDNPASCRVLEKAGFQLEGILRHAARKNGVIKNQAIYAFLREDA